MNSAEQESLRHTADYQHAAEFVDALIAQKYPDGAPTGANAEDHTDLREQIIKTLNDEIESRLVDRLTDEQQDQLNAIAEQGGDVQAAFLNFFIKAGINFNQIVKDTMMEFAHDFLADTDADATNAADATSTQDAASATAAQDTAGGADD